MQLCGAYTVDVGCSQCALIGRRCKSQIKIRSSVAVLGYKRLSTNHKVHEYSPYVVQPHTTPTSPPAAMTAAMVSQ